MAVYSLINNQRNVNQTRVTTLGPNSYPLLFCGLENIDHAKMQVKWDAEAAILDVRFKNTTNNPWEHNQLDP